KARDAPVRILRQGAQIFPSTRRPMLPSREAERRKAYVEGGIPMRIDSATAEREVVIDAPAAAVFAALTEPGQIVRWWGDDTLQGRREHEAGWGRVLGWLGDYFGNG